MAGSIFLNRKFHPPSGTYHVWESSPTADFTMSQATPPYPPVQYTDHVVIARIGGSAGGGSDVDAIHDNIAGEISAITEKIAPDLADLLIIEDSTSGNVKKKVRVTNLLRPRVVSKSTGSYVITLSENGTVFTNVGSGGIVALILPSAALGLQYSFYNQDPGGLLVVAAGSDTVRLGGNVSAAGGNIASSALGDSIKLVAVSSTEWAVVGGFTGVWTVT